MNQSNWRDHKSYLDVLELATTLNEDEFGNSRYEFEGDRVEVILEYNWLDGDTEITMFISGQEESVLQMNLVGCKEIVANDDKRGKYIEFSGQVKNENFSRGRVKKSFGFRLRLEPFINIEPFYSES